MILELELLASSRYFSLWQTYICMFAHIHILKEAIESEMTTQCQCLKQESINCCCFAFRCISQCLHSDTGQEDPNSSSMYGELRADFTYSCQGRDVLTVASSNKLIGLGAPLCSSCCQELSYYVSRSCGPLLPVYSFLCFMPPKNECPGLLLSLLW